MLPGERSLPEAIVAPDGEIVNRLFDCLSREADQHLAQRLANHLRAVQIQLFAAQRKALFCPRCSGQNLIRKGWRERIISTSRGRIRLVVLQARCRVCGRSFRPLNNHLGLPSSRRLLAELEAKAVFLGTQVSFARSASMLRNLTRGSISAEGIRRKIADRAKEIHLPAPGPGDTVLVDATKVKAGTKERGESVHLAVTAQPGPKQGKRPTSRKQLVHLHVGKTGPLMKRLQKIQPDHLVHDGGEDYTGCAKSVQRCRWHLGHQLKHYLWQDGVPHEFRSTFQSTLLNIMRDREQGPERYTKWARNLAGCGLSTAAGHMQNAADEAFTYLKEPGFAYIDTSPLEREMRELNRRADIGARWSPKGVENVLKVLFHQRLNECPEGQA